MLEETSPIQEEIKTLEKKFKRLQERHKELSREMHDAKHELVAVRSQLGQAKKEADEAVISHNSIVKSKTDTDIEFRHLSALKKDKEKEILEARGVRDSEQIKLNEFLLDETAHKENIRKEMQQIQSQREALERQKKMNEKKIHDEQRSLQQQFQQTKQQIKRDHRQEIENLKAQTQKEMDEAKKQSVKAINDLNTRLGAKIESLSNQNRRDYKELDGVNIELRELTALAQRLERELKKESSASDAAGTSTIQWATAKKMEANEFGRSEVSGLEERVSALRDTLMNVGEELQLSQTQKKAAETQFRQLKKELIDQELMYQRLESSKNDLERRLTKRVEETEEQIKRRDDRLTDEHELNKIGLTTSIKAKEEEAALLKKKIDDLSIELVLAQRNAENLAERLSSKLEEERDYVLQMVIEKEKSVTLSHTLRLEISSCQDKIVKLEKEVNREKKLVETLYRQLGDLEGDNETLESSIKRLESRF